MIFQLVYPSSGSQVAGTSPGSSGQKAGPTLHKTPCITGPLAPTLRWEQCRHNIHLMCTSLGCGRKLGSLEKPRQTWEEHAHSTQIVDPQRSNFFSHQHSTETMLNEMTLLKDLLYILLWARVSGATFHSFIHPSFNEWFERPWGLTRSFCLGGGVLMGQAHSPPWTCVYPREREKNCAEQRTSEVVRSVLRSDSK